MALTIYKMKKTRPSTSTRVMALMMDMERSPTRKAPNLSKISYVWEWHHLDDDDAQETSMGNRGCKKYFLIKNATTTWNNGLTGIINHIGLPDLPKDALLPNPQGQRKQSYHHLVIVTFQKTQSQVEKCLLCLVAFPHRPSARPSTV